ncbi:hypothetical protein FBQ82_10880 [Anaerolineae bacterium CFX7]|nr:hypothetical protein [Anaerolineae bacterium CFX7]
MNPPRAWFILSIWAEEQLNGALVWRGFLESAAGKRFHFASLDALNEMLKQLGGWNETPYSPQSAFSPEQQGMETE